MGFLSGALNVATGGLSGSIMSDKNRTSKQFGSSSIAPRSVEEEAFLTFMGSQLLPQIMEASGFDMVQDIKGKWILAPLKEAPSIEEEREEEIAAQFQENTMRFLKGDFALTEREKEATASQFAPLRAAIEEAYGEEGAAAQGMEADINKFSRELTRNTNEIAAQSGRSPMDPEFQMQIQQGVADEVGRRKLELAEKKGQALIGVEQQSINLRLSRFDPSIGGSALNTARQGSQLARAIKQQKVQNLMGGYSGLSGLLQNYQRDRFGFTKTEGSEVGSKSGAILGGIKAGVDIAKGAAAYGGGG